MSGQYVYIGISATAYYKWIQGRALPTLDHLVILRKMCNVSLDELIVVREDFDTEQYRYLCLFDQTLFAFKGKPIF